MRNEKMEKDWLVLETANEVAEKGLELILNTSRQCIEDHGKFNLVLAGGTTPKHIYTLLAEQSCDWNKWHFYIGDERCLPKNDPERNSEMIRTTLLEKIHVPKDNIHFIEAELGADEAAKKYAEVIKSKTPFDLVMLGMGEDGHTASLFPGHIHNNEERVHAVYNSPKPPTDRVSLSANILSQNNNLLLLITGESKQTAVQQWHVGIELPITTISSLGQKVVLLDQSAALS